MQKCRINSSGILPLTGEFELTPTIKKRNKAFIEDCLKGNYEKVREKCKLIDPNCWAEEEGNETPLVVAILNDDRELMNILLEHGAHLDYKLGSKEQWKSPLHIAAIHNKLKAAQLLLAAGAWSNIVDGLGLSPLYYAATYGHKDIVHRLLVARSLTDVCDENGKSPLHQVFSLHGIKYLTLSRYNLIFDQFFLISILLYLKHFPDLFASSIHSLLIHYPL